MSHEQKPVETVRSSGPVGDGLSLLQWILFSVLFLNGPCVITIVAPALYFAWRSDRPRRARQILVLGLVFFVLSPVLYVLVAIILLAQQQR